MYFVLKSLKFFIYVIQLYMFRTTLCPSSGASQLHKQSLVPINYKNTCCLQICHYIHFIITANYLCGTYKPFINLYVCFVLFCFWLWLCGIVFCIILLLHTVWCLARCVLQSCYVVTAAFSCVCGSVLIF